MAKEKFPMPTEAEFKSIVLYVSDFNTSKVREASEKRNRITVETKLAALIPGPDDGQRTITLPGKVKVVVKRGFLLKADVGRIEKLCLEEGLHPPVKSAAGKTLDVDGYEWYKKNNPEFFAKLAKLVERKPSKVAVTIKN